MTFDPMVDVDPECHTLPKGSDPGRILFWLYPIPDQLGSYWERYDVEVVDYDGDKAPFWMQEGAGIDYWVNEHIDLELEGCYVIESATVTWSKDYWGEVDEHWEIGTIRRATQEEMDRAALS